MITKKDLQEEIKSVKKELKEAIDGAIVDIVESISKVAATKVDVKELNEKLTDTQEEMKREFREVKRQINDLKADTPTPQEYKVHEKRIKQLETAVFPS